MTTQPTSGQAARPAPRWRLLGRLGPHKQALIIALAILAGLLVTWWYFGQWYEERLLLEQRAEVVGEISARDRALAAAVNRRLARLQGLYAFVQTEGADPDFPQKFDSFAASLYAGSRGIRNLAVAPDGEVRYVYPREGNESVLGYRPLLDPRPEVAADAMMAIDSGQVALTGPVELVQGGQGLIARQAVFRDGVYWGLVNVVIDFPPLLAEAGLEGASGRLAFALRNAEGDVFYGSESIFAGSPIITRIDLPDGYWELAGSPPAGWSALIRQPLLVSRLGSLVTIFLVAGLIYLTASRQAQLSAAVAQRTRELSAANRLLENRVEERTLELTMLLNITRSVSSTLELQALLEQIMRKLHAMVEFTSGSIMALEDGEFVIRTYSGPYPEEMFLGRRFTFDDPIDRQIREEKQPAIVDDILAEAPLAAVFRQATGAYQDWPQDMRSWMGVPLVVRERVIGMLTLDHREVNIYDGQSAKLAMAFADQVAVAIENARLHEQAQRLAVLQERQRLARELHDSVSQALYGIALGARTARALLDRAQLPPEKTAPLGEPLDYMLSLSEGALAEMRALIFELRPEALDKEGLSAALVRQAAAVQARHRISVGTDLCQEPETPLHVKEVLYRVAQEALHNVVKHAQATQVEIRLRCDGGRLHLQIHDDGQGFDPTGDFPGHWGLRTMRERVERLQGWLTVTSSPGQGTTVEAVIEAR